MVWIRFDFVYNQISNDWGPLSYKIWVRRIEASCFSLKIILQKDIKEVEFRFLVCLHNQMSNWKYTTMKWQEIFSLFLLQFIYLMLRKYIINILDKFFQGLHLIPVYTFYLLLNKYLRVYYMLNLLATKIERCK